MKVLYQYTKVHIDHCLVWRTIVGTGRGILYVKKNGHIFVWPDNGVFSFLFPAETIIEITWRPQGAVSSTFHGRDIFALLVARILAGDDIYELGKGRDAGEDLLRFITVRHTRIIEGHEKGMPHHEELIYYGVIL